jgi:hypothetical protein
LPAMVGEDGLERLNVSDPSAQAKFHGDATP